VYITPVSLCELQSTSVCTFPFVPQTPGDPVVVGIGYGGALSTGQKTITGVQDDGAGGGSNWQLSTCPGATCTQGYISAHSTDMAYTTSAAMAMGHITVTVTGFSGSATPWQIFAVELRPSKPPVYLDTSGSASDSSSGTTWTGVILSPTSTDVIVQVLHGGSVNSISTNPSGTNYSSNLSDVGLFGAAFSVNTSVGTAPVFGGSTSSTAAASAMAFAETSTQPSGTTGVAIVARGVKGQGIVVAPAVSLISITSTSPLPNCTIGTPFTFPFNASGGVQPYTWSLYSGSLQPGLTLASTGILSGTCTNSSGTATFTVQVCDSESPAACTTGQFQQTAQNTPPPTLMVCDSTSSPTCPNPPATGVSGTFYGYSFSAIGGTAPYTWAVTSGSIPTGLSLSSAGVLSGFPFAPGTFSYTVQVTDSTTPTPETATASFSTTISGYSGNPAVALEPQNWVTAHQGGVNTTTGNPCAITDSAGSCTWNLPKTCNAANHCIHEQLGFGSNDHPATLAGLYEAGCDWSAMGSILGGTYAGQNWYLWVEVANGSVLTGAPPFVSSLFHNPAALYVSPVKQAGLQTPMPSGLPSPYNSGCPASTVTPNGPYTLAGSVTSGTFVLGEEVKQQTSGAEANLLYVTCTLGSGSNPAPWIAGSTGGTSSVMPNCSDAGDAQTGPISLGMFTGGSPSSNNSYVWIGQTSGAVFTQSATAAANGYFRLTGQCSSGAGSGSPNTPGYPVGSNDTPCINLTDEVPCFHSILDSSITWMPLCSNDLPSMFTIEASALGVNNSNQIEQDGNNTFLSGFEVTFAQGQNQSMVAKLSNYYPNVQTGLSPQLISIDCGSCGRDHYWAHGWDPGDTALHAGDPSQLSFSQTNYPVTPWHEPRAI
jgi:hypothetical protein